MKFGRWGGGSSSADAAYPAGDVGGGADGMPYPGTAQAVTVETASVDVRLGFIRKVYLLLTINFSITIGIGCACAFIDRLREFMVENLYVLWIALAITFASLIVLSCFPPPYPFNMIIMYVFVLSMSICIGVVVAQYFESGQGLIVLQAFIATGAVFAAVTTYVSVTKKDFSFLYGFLTAALITLLVLTVLNWVLYPFTSDKFSRWVSFGIACAGQGFAFELTNETVVDVAAVVVDTEQALIMIGYLFYDTSMVITRYGPDDWLHATLALYVDVTNLFLYFLQIFSFIAD